MAGVFSFPRVFAIGETVSVSPDKKYKIVESWEEIGDSNVKYTFELAYAVDGRLRTRHLLTCVRHDWPPPEFFWSKDSTHIVFGRGCDERPETVVVYNVRSFSDVHAVPGTFAKYDAEHDVVIYLQFELRERKQLPTWKVMKLDVLTKRTEKLMDLDWRERSPEEYPGMQLDTRARVATVEFKRVSY